MHYFASDGNYGSASDLVVIHTDSWDYDDWDKILEAQDHERYQVAQQIAESKKRRITND